MPEATNQKSGGDAAPGRDEDLGDIFRTMRQALGLSPSELASKLETGTATIAALERGALGDLPEWPETQRVVTSYAALLKLDCRPILRRIAIHKGADSEAPAPQPDKSKEPAEQTSVQIADIIAGAFALIAVVLAAVVVGIIYIVVGGEDDGGKTTAEAPAARQQTSPESSPGPSGPVSVRRVPLPPTLEGPSGTETVDR
jgi:cytoskeletal protein RodZ